MRQFIVVAMLAAGLSLPGCIYVPPVWDIADEIHKVDQIHEGMTRKEVLKLLGEPDARYEKNRFFIYRGEWSDGHIIFGTPWVGPVYGGLIDEEDWQIKISFDETGVVQAVSTVLPGGAGGLDLNIVDDWY